MILSFDGNFDDSHQDVLRILQKLSVLQTQPAERTVKINLKSTRYLGPFATSALAAEWLYAQNRNQKTRVVLPDGPMSLKAYCMFSGFTHLVGKGEPPERDHPQNENDPLQRVGEPPWNIGDGLIRLIERHRPISSDLALDLRTSVAEMTQNAFDHAQSPIGSVMTCKFVISKHDVYVGIVDRGVGIYSSLSAKHPDVVDSRDALARVAKGGYSAKSRRNNMGLGISNLGDTVANLGGSATLVSGNAAIQDWGKDLFEPTSLEFTYNGTAVFFRVPCS